MWRARIGTLLVALAVAGLAAGPAASAQSTRDVRVRDRLIADQENLLNTYRCRFSVDGQFCPDSTVEGLTFATWLTRVLDHTSSADPISRLVELGVAAPTKKNTPGWLTLGST